MHERLFIDFYRLYFLLELLDLDLNHICLIREVDNTGIRGNQHNSGYWNYVPRNANSPNTTNACFESGRSSIVDPSKISSVNSSVIGRNVVTNLDLRRDHIAYNMRQFYLNQEEQILDQNTGALLEEITITKKGLVGKMNLGFKYKDSTLSRELNKVECIYIKYHDIGKRKFYWKIWEKHKNDYTSYAEFKKSWDPNLNIWKQIAHDVKANVKDEVKKLVEVKRPFVRPLDYNHRYPIDNRKYPRLRR